MKSGGGSIVLISSAAARVGLANHEAIGAAKAGIIGLGLSAAATYAFKNIRGLLKKAASGVLAIFPCSRTTRTLRA